MINISTLRQLEKEGLITLKSNQKGNLFIANYTPKVQYERLWTELLLKCRGLIIDEENQIIARPFPKFFNLEEHKTEDIPSERFEVYEKLDGSLGILYYHEDWRIVTRSSFFSEQAEKATELLHSKYSRYLDAFEKDKTYLFEIIYPDNRIVVDYGDRESLVLLGIIDTQTGIEYPIEGFDYPEQAKRYDGIKELDSIRKLEDTEREGFVIEFDSGFRVKVKFAEYLRLHKIFTQVSSRTIWAYLKDGKSFDDLLDKVPDEFYEWVRKVRQDLEREFETLYAETQNTYADAPAFKSRKEFAQWANEQAHPGLLFCLLDGRNIEEKIWKLLRPEHARPFQSHL